MNVGDRLKQLRKELNIPQAEIAMLLGVAQQQISYYEKNGNLDNKRLAAVARNYNIDIRYFYEEGPLSSYKTETLRPAGTGGPDIPAGWSDLLDEISALDHDKIKFIETVLKALLKEFSG